MDKLLEALKVTYQYALDTSNFLLSEELHTELNRIQKIQGMMRET